MKLSLLVLGHPQSSQSPATALRFAKAAIANGHSIYRIFFYHDGVHCASTLNVTPQDEYAVNAQWQAFINKEQLDAVVCISSALKRGIIDQSEAERHDVAAHNLSPAFELSGLDQLVDASINSDRLITFSP